MSAEQSEPAAPRVAPEREPSRFAVVGVSEDEICGVRDYATVLTEGLRAQGAACTTHWLLRRASTLRAERAEFARWLDEVSRALPESRPDAILLHYSVFAYSHRGVPVHVRAVRLVLERSGVPVIVVGHELAYPFGRHSWRGSIWAAGQRVALFGLVRSSAALVLTTELRAQWLSTRRLLAKRPVAVVPVFSNLPAPRASLRETSVEAEAIGLFGYTYQGERASVVLDALAVLSAWRPSLRFVLLGAPGPDSQVGRRWQELAREREVGDAIEFSGTLPPQELSDAIAGCDVLLFVDAPGPTSRKGSLAAALASGRPVVATDGPERWQHLVDGDAVRLAEPTGNGLAAEIRALLEDTAERDALGLRGRTFYERQMAVPMAAQSVLRLFDQLESHAGASRSSSSRQTLSAAPS